MPPIANSLRDHPLRGRIVAEMHLRRLPPISAPAILYQVVTIVSGEQRAQEHAAMCAMPGVATADLIERTRHIEGMSADGAHYFWERHSEASTATVVVSQEPRKDFDAFRDGAAFGWLTSSPGLTIRAVLVEIVSDDEEALRLLPGFAFDESQLVSCWIGEARIWSDFRVQASGFGILLIAANGTPPADMGRLIQNLQELGNYRNLALLGLPLAQDLAPRLEAIEGELVEIAGQIGNRPDDMLLDALCRLAARAAAMAAAGNFRMSATKAYAEIVDQRLLALDCRPIGGYQSLDQFTQRRLRPGVSTCASFVSRLENASVRIERSTSLLRTRVDLAMQQQNTALLASMDRNAVRQLHLQQVVEGLSVVAISYYAFNLIDHLIGGIAVQYGLRSDIVSAALVIPVCVGAYLTLRSRKRGAIS